MIIIMKLKKNKSKNEQFLQETKSNAEQLIAFELILQERQNKNIQMLKEIKDHFYEKGALYGNQNINRRFLEDLFYYR